MVSGEELASCVLFPQLRNLTPLFYCLPWQDCVATSVSKYKIQTPFLAHFYPTSFPFQRCLPSRKVTEPHFCHVFQDKPNACQFPSGFFYSQIFSENCHPTPSSDIVWCLDKLIYGNDTYLCGIKYGLDTCWLIVENRWISNCQYHFHQG